MPYAVVRTGGKQYKVEPGDVFRVESLEGEPGATVELREVLATGDGEGSPRVGSPLVEGASVTARIVEQTKARKVLVFKKKRRKDYRRKKGHRQPVTTLQVLDIHG